MRPSTNRSRSRARDGSSQRGGRTVSFGQPEQASNSNSRSRSKSRSRLPTFRQRNNRVPGPSPRHISHRGKGSDLKGDCVQGDGGRARSNSGDVEQSSPVPFSSGKSRSRTSKPHIGHGSLDNNHSGPHVGHSPDPGPKVSRGRSASRRRPSVCNSKKSNADFGHGGPENNRSGPHVGHGSDRNPLPPRGRSASRRRATLSGGNSLSQLRGLQRGDSVVELPLKQPNVGPSKKLTRSSSATRSNPSSSRARSRSRGLSAPRTQTSNSSGNPKKSTFIDRPLSQSGKLQRSDSFVRGSDLVRPTSATRGRSSSRSRPSIPSSESIVELTKSASRRRPSHSSGNPKKSNYMDRRLSQAGDLQRSDSFVHGSDPVHPPSASRGRSSSSRRPSIPSSESVAELTQLCQLVNDSSCSASASTFGSREKKEKNTFDTNKLKEQQNADTHQNSNVDDIILQIGRVRERSRSRSRGPSRTSTSTLTTKSLSSWSACSSAQDKIAVGNLSVSSSYSAKRVGSERAGSSARDKMALEGGSRSSNSSHLIAKRVVPPPPPRHSRQGRSSCPDIASPNSTQTADAKRVTCRPTPGRSRRPEVSSASTVQDNFSASCSSSSSQRHPPPPPPPPRRGTSSKVIPMQQQPMQQQTMRQQPIEQQPMQQQQTMQCQPIDQLPMWQQQMWKLLLQQPPMQQSSMQQPQMQQPPIQQPPMQQLQMLHQSMQQQSQMQQQQAQTQQQSPHLQPIQQNQTQYQPMQQQQPPQQQHQTQKQPGQEQPAMQQQQPQYRQPQKRPTQHQAMQQQPTQQQLSEAFPELQPQDQEIDSSKEWIKYSAGFARREQAAIPETGGKSPNRSRSKSRDRIYKKVSDEQRLTVRTVKRMPFTDQFGDFGFYTGDVDMDGRPDGKGSIKYENGIFYEGNWEAGCQDKDAASQYGRIRGGFTSWSGKGKSRTNSKAVLPWNARKNCAQNGEGKMNCRGMEWEDHHGNSGRYTGEINDDQLPHGNGVMRYEFGLIVEGEWKNGVLKEGPQDRMIGVGVAMNGGQSVFPEEVVSSSMSVGPGAEGFASSAVSVLGNGGISVAPSGSMGVSRMPPMRYGENNPMMASVNQTRQKSRRDRYRSIQSLSP